MSGKNVHIIANPIAGGGRAGRLIPKLLPRIEKRFGTNYSIHVTQKPNEATIIARNSILAGANLIIALGGDGTVQEIVNGFFHDTKIINPDCELGILNYGTGKGLTQTLNLPSTLEEQLDLIASSSNNLIDVGYIKCKDKRGSNQERFFVNECQVGIGGVVVTGVSMWHKYLGGTLAFGSVTLKQALFFNAPHMMVEFDDKQKISGNLIGVVVGNGAFCSGGMKLTPDAKPNDGQFDILLIHDMHIFSRIWNFTKIYSGRHIKSQNFALRRSKSISIKSEERVLIEADGELTGIVPCKISLIPAVLKVKSII